MRTLLKNFLLLAALSLATWAAVLGIWYARQRVPSREDALQYLVVLPLLLFAGVLAVRGWPRGAAPSSPEPEAPGDTGPASAAPPAEASFPLLAAWVNTPAGADAFALLSALAEGQPRPRPDPLLRDMDGLPVLAARIAALDAARVQAELPAEHAPLSPAAQRALAALAPLLDQAVETLADPTDGDARAPALHVLAHWPATWSEAEARTAQAWLTRRLSPAAATPPPVSGSGAELLREAQAHLAQLRQAGRDARVLLLACHSELDDACVQRLEREGRLHAMPRCPRGLVPGEAAAALLLSTRAGTDADIDTAAEAPAPVRLRALRLQPRPTAASASPRALAAAVPLQALLDDTLRAAAMERAGLMNLCTDADQLTEAAIPVYALAQAALPHLDPVDDLRLVGTCCGHTGAVAPLLALAAAWAQCQQRAQPVAVLCVTEAGSQLAAVLGPGRGPA